MYLKIAMSQKIIPISKARKELFTIAEEVQTPGEYYSLTIDGEAKVVVLSYNEFRSLREMVELLSNPTLLKTIEHAEEELQHNNFYTWEEVKERVGIVKELPVVRDRGANRYQFKKKVNK